MTTWNAMTEEGGHATPTDRLATLGDGNAMGSLMAQAEGMAKDISGSNVSLMSTPAPDKGKGGRGF